MASFMIAQTGTTTHLNTGKQNGRILFRENKGQVVDQHHTVRNDVFFSGETGNMVFHLTKDGVSYQSTSIETWKHDSCASPHLSTSNMRDEHCDSSCVVPDQIMIYRTDIQWVGANHSFGIEKGAAVGGYENYYLGHCPQGILGVQSFESIIYKNLYERIDVKWYENAGALEYDYIVRPGGDYRAIKWNVDGATHIWVDEQGTLKIETPIGTLQEDAPVAFQNKRQVPARWVVDGTEVSFAIDDFDDRLTLVIDPVVRMWATYYGHGALDRGRSCAAYRGGVYMAGDTRSTSNIATTGAHKTVKNLDEDAFLVKFDQAGVRQWGTYYGGYMEDYGFGCTTDGTHVYMTGHTNSNSISGIATAGAYQTSKQGTTDAFLVQFDTNGVRTWGTYFGGPSLDYAYGCASDSTSVYITGNTHSSSGLASSGAHQTTYGGGFDAFLAKFSSSGVRLWSTYYGGNIGSSIPQKDLGYACATDGNAVYMAGYTTSLTEIATSGSHQPTKGSTYIEDAFLVKLNSNGVRQWGTYYGGPDIDRAEGVDVRGNSVYITGRTLSTTGIATSGTQQPSLAALYDVFLAKFDTMGVRQWGTYYGGPEIEAGYSCKATDNGVYISGYTYSSSGISTTGVHQQSYGGSSKSDGLIAKFNTNGYRQWSTYYGGSESDHAYECSIAGTVIYVAGYTGSLTAIASTNAHQTTGGGFYGDAWLARFCEPDESIDTIAACDSLTWIDDITYYAYNNTATFTLTNQAGCDSVVTLNLSMGYSSETHQTDTACNYFTWPVDGKVYNSTGMYTAILAGAFGCDSVVTLDLTMYTVDTSITQNGSTLTSNQNNGTYQWLNCDSSHAPIAGETNQSFTALSNGSYALEVTHDGCVDTSACVHISSVGIGSINTFHASLYPNPNQGTFTLDFAQAINEGFQVYTRDMQGRILSVSHHANTQVVSIDSRVAPGMYRVDVVSDQFSWGTTMVVQ